jgi:hypothetical protein
MESLRQIGLGLAGGLSIVLATAGCTRAPEGTAPESAGPTSEATSQAITSSAGWIPEDAPPQVRQLLLDEGRENEACRGGSGDEPTTTAACARRDTLSAELERKGWCYGQGASSGADSIWAKCVNVDKEYAECLTEKVKVGDYSSFDGGASALLLMNQCEPQWRLYSNECVNTGEGSDGECTLKAGILAQAAIKIQNK